jgi:hypothetical protein
MLRANCNVPAPGWGFAFNPALRFLLCDEAGNSLTFTVGPANSAWRPESGWNSVWRDLR